MDAKHRFRKLAVRLVFFVLLGWLVALVRAVRPRRGWDEWSDGDERKALPAPSERDSGEKQQQQPAVSRTSRRPKLATSFGLVVVFFAAASFTAGAGDLVSKALEPARCAALMQATGEDETICAEVAQQEAQADALAAPPEAMPAEEPAAAPAEDASAEAPVLDGALAQGESGADLAPAAEAAPDAAGEATESGQIAETTEPTAQPTEAPQAPASNDAAVAPEAEDPDAYILAPELPAAAPKVDTRHWVVRRAKESQAKAPVVENEGGSPTIWLNRALPDPTPPAKRLSPQFAKNLQRISAVNGVNWALVLGVLRAEGARDRVPATVRELNALARGLSQRGAADSEWNAVLALSGRTGFADRAIALARYNRVVGLRALVNGLQSEKAALAQRLLHDKRATIYYAGREDIQAGRIDVRVVVLVSYLAESYGEVTVSSLFSGHRKYARPGVISAHIHGHAVDISTVGRTSIAGHQEPGSITEKAVRSILMLPVEIQPRQVISLLGLGGPSFPMADHGDHIHVGF